MTIYLAAFLSFLMVLGSASVSTCDLSCWLRQLHSDCHRGGPAASKDSDMSMSSNMDMGNSDSATGAEFGLQVASGYPMSMSPQGDMAIKILVERSMNSSIRESEANGVSCPFG